jgi:hypothetical protein
MRESIINFMKYALEFASGFLGRSPLGSQLLVGGWVYVCMCVFLCMCMGVYVWTGVYLCKCV